LKPKNSAEEGVASTKKSTLANQQDKENQQDEDK
jgi:hypothetical protein